MDQREITKLFGTVGFKIDFKALQQLDERLKALSKRIKGLQTSSLSQVSKTLKEVSRAEREAIKNEQQRVRLQSQRVELARKEESVRTQAARTDLINFRRQVSQQRQLAAQQRQAAREATAQAKAAAAFGPPAPSTRYLASLNRPGGRVSPSFQNPVGRPAQGGIAGFVSGLMGGPGAFARGLIPGLGAGFAVREIAASGRRQVGQDLAFEAMFGNQAAGMAEMDWVKSLSNRIGLVSVDAADQYKGILAAGMNNKDVGVAGARKIFEATSSYGRIMGLDPERMKRAQMAISQMLSKGKVSSEELRLQLAEHMPAAIGMFAKAVTGSSEKTAELWEKMEKGEVISSEVLPKVAEEMMRVAYSGDAMKKAMETSTVAQARFTNAWNDFIKKVFTGGADKGLAALFNVGAKAIESFGTIVTKIVLPALGALATAISPALELFGDFVDLVAYLVESNPLLMGVFATLTAGMLAMPTAIRAIGGAFNLLMRSPAILAFVSAMLMLQDLLYYMTGRGSAIGDMIAESTQGEKPMNAVQTAGTMVRKTIVGAAAGLGGGTEIGDRVARGLDAALGAFGTVLSFPASISIDKSLPYTPERAVNLVTPSMVQGSQQSQMVVENNITIQGNADDATINAMTNQLENVMSQFRAAGGGE